MNLAGIQMLTDNDRITTLFDSAQSSLVIGVPFIDREHQRLFFTLNKLIQFSSCQENDLNFFDHFSQLGLMIYSHFEHENIFMDSLDIPLHLAQSHRKEHNEIIEQYVKLNLDLMNGSVPEKIQITEMARDWIIGHLLRQDLLLCSFIPLKTNRHQFPHYFRSTDLH